MELLLKHRNQQSHLKSKHIFSKISVDHERDNKVTTRTMLFRDQYLVTK